jgi:hypothetical protein
METAMSAITTKEASADAKVATMSVESSGTVANQDDARPVATMVGAHDESSLELELKLHQSEAEALEAESSRLQNEIHELEQKLAQLKNDQTRNQTALVEKRKWIELNEWYLWLSRADETDNAPKKRRVEDESMLPMGYVHSLGTTLLGLGQNSNDATGARTPFSIPLVLRLLLPASCVPFDHVDFEAQASEHLKPLLQHVATSSTLRRIVMSEKPRSWCRDRDTFQAVNDFLVTSFLDAMSCNPIIDTVEFSCPVPASTFSRYAMATSSTLKRLVMDLEPLRDTPVEDLKSLVVAFQAMNALESLTMLEFDGGLLNRFVIPSLESIRIGCFALHELKLRAGIRFRKNSLLWNQLAKVCHSARHGRLQHLELHGFHFEKSDLEGLVKCLKCPVDNHGDVQSLPVLGIA